MFSYFVGVMLDYLETDSIVRESEVVSLEWVYFRAVRFSQRSVRTARKNQRQQPPG